MHEFQKILEYLPERVEALLERICEKEDLSGTEHVAKWILLTERMDMTYFELRSLIIYLNKYVSNSTTKTVFNEIIRVLSKMELGSTRIPGMTKARMKISKKLMR